MKAAFVFGLFVLSLACVADARASDLLSLSIAWATRLDSPPAARLAADDRHVYLALRSGDVVALGLRDGREVWRSDLPAVHGLVAGEGRLFLTADGLIVALEARSGRVLWRISVATAPVAPVWRDGSIMIGTADAQLLALRTTDGAELWRQQVGAALRQPVSVEGEHAYAALADGSLVSVDVKTGAIHWRVPLPGLAGPVLAAGDRVYVGAEDNYFYSLNAVDGRRRWRWRTGADVVGRPALDERRVYFASMDNVVRALDAASGVQHWRRPLDTRPRAGPILEEGLVVVAGSGAELRILQAATGAVAGRWTAPGELVQPPLVLGDRSREAAIRAVIVSGGATGDWRAYGLGRALEPPPAPLTEIPGRPLSPDAPPVLPEPQPKGV